jgi:pimeloyl-CoA synthetase
MSEQKRQILQMLAEGKINTDEAERLLNAVETETTSTEATEQAEPEKDGKPRFLHIKVHSEPGSHHKHENVDVKVPLVLLKAGMKLHSIMPEKAKSKINAHLAEKGVDFDLNHIDAEHIESIIQALTESAIDIEADQEKIKIYCA